MTSTAGNKHADRSARTRERFITAALNSDILNPSTSSRLTFQNDEQFDALQNRSAMFAQVALAIETLLAAPALG